MLHTDIEILLQAAQAINMAWPCKLASPVLVIAFNSCTPLKNQPDKSSVKSSLSGESLGYIMSNVTVTGMSLKARSTVAITVINCKPLTDSLRASRRKLHFPCKISEHLPNDQSPSAAERLSALAEAEQFLEEAGDATRHSALAVQHDVHAAWIGLVGGHVQLLLSGQVLNGWLDLSHMILGMIALAHNDDQVVLALQPHECHTSITSPHNVIARRPLHDSS